MNKFSVDYSQRVLNFVEEDIRILFRICEDYRKSIGDPLAVGFDKEVNLLCRIDFDERGTLKQVREFLTDTTLYHYLKTFIDQAENNDIKEVSTFRCWIQGNDDGLPMSGIKKLSAHTHPFRIPNDMGPSNTRTFVVPLLLRESITEYFWAKYIENTLDTVPKDFVKLQTLLKSMKLSSQNSEKLKTKQNSDFMNCWQNLRESYSTEEKKYFLPDKNTQMIIDFNSKNWLHGVDNINSNLYLFVLFDDYIV
jgi:hypothetical protein